MSIAMFTAIKKEYHRWHDRRKARRKALTAKLSHLLHQDSVETKIFAHRGSKSNRPENTLAAFSEAIKVGSDGIELDVHLTKDNQIVVIHDESIDRTTNGTGLIRDLTFKDIRQYSAGAWFDTQYKFEKVPLLSEVLDLLCDLKFTGILNIEIKTDNFAYFEIEKLTSDLLTSKPYTFSHIYCSFNLESLKRLSEFEPNVDLCYLMSTSDKKIAEGLKADYITSLHPHINWVKKNADKLRKIHKPLRPWTINDDCDLYFAFNHHLAGFMTDYPELANKIKQRYNEKK